MKVLLLVIIMLKGVILKGIDKNEKKISEFFINLFHKGEALNNFKQIKCIYWL